MMRQLDQSVPCREKTRTSGFVQGIKTGAWIVPTVAVLVAGLLIVFQHTHFSQAGGKFFTSLVYSTLIGLPCSLTLNLIAFRFAERFPRLVVLMYIAALLAIGSIGCFAGAYVLQIVGIVPRDYYWREIQSSFPICIVVTVLVGLSITSFESLRHKLQSATLELRTRQMEQERANKLLVEARLSSLESRIHPHFLFNTLNSISSLIASDPKRAEDTVGRLASLLRFSLNANHSSLVPLAQELKIVREYLEIESTRFGSRLRYTISVPDDLAALKVPPLALQALVENSVKHVVAQCPEGGSIQITGRARPESIQLEVVDDGPGFSLASISPEHGLGNLSVRLQLLYEERGQLDVIREGDKTIARISLPAES
jgi:sensor histidine kinase YesM